VKRKRRSRAAWIKICEAYEASGETPAVFARRRGLNRGTFGWWRSKLRREGAEVVPQTAAFVEVVGEPTSARAAGAVVRVGGISIEFDEAPAASWVAELAARC